MTDEATPIAYTALQPGTPVQSIDGQEFGTVEAVLVVEEVDVFDGIVVNTAEGLRFIDADHVGTITDGYVRSSLTAAEAAKLPEPSAASVFETDAGDDAGSSIADRFGRMFSRGKWNQEK